MTDSDDSAVATTTDNAKLEHTAGGATTRDPMDAGVPMIQGKPTEPVGPEDALGPGAKRGDYSDRLSSGPSMATRPIPEDERMTRATARAKAAGAKSGLTVEAALADEPRFELVRQGEDAGKVGDEPGKGGVSTAAAKGAVEADVAAATA